MKTLEDIVQSYVGMTPQDQNTKNWAEMKDKMVIEIQEHFDTVHKSDPVATPIFLFDTTANEEDDKQVYDILGQHTIMLDPTRSEDIIIGATFWFLDIKLAKIDMLTIDNVYGDTFFYRTNANPDIVESAPFECLFRAKLEPTHVVVDHNPKYYKWTSRYEKTKFIYVTPEHKTIEDKYVDATGLNPRRNDSIYASNYTSQYIDWLNEEALKK